MNSITRKAVALAITGLLAVGIVAATEQSASAIRFGKAPVSAQK